MSNEAGVLRGPQGEIIVVNEQGAKTFDEQSPKPTHKPNTPRVTLGPQHEPIFND